MKKRLLTLLLALCLFASLALPVSAAGTTLRLEDAGLRVTIPSSYTVFTPDAPVQTLPDGTKIDYQDYLAQEELSLAALNADQSVMLQIFAQDDSSGEFNDLTDKQLLSMRTTIQSSYAKSGYTLTDYQVYHQSQTKFVCADFTVNDDSGPVYVRIYLTMFQGKQVGIGLQATTKAAFDAGVTALQSVMESVVFDKHFPDVSKSDASISWCYDAVIWAANSDPVITTGTSANQFSPKANCTRGQMVTFLWRAAGEPEPKSKTNPFKDVKSGTFYYKAVLWAYENGITTGTSKTAFSPDATVTRGQTVTFLWRLAKEPKVSGKNVFRDVKSGQFYTTAVIWAAKEGITTGTSKTTFSPDASCTRGQIVTFLYRYYH